MIVGYDAKRIAQNRTGLGNYGRFVVHGLMDRLHTVLFVPNRQKMQQMGKDIAEHPQVEIAFPHRCWSKCFSSLWRSVWLTPDIRQHKLDIFHGLSGELPLCGKAKGTKYILTVHDVIYRRFPQCYKPVSRWIYDYKCRKACEKADVVVAVSECTKRDVVEFYGVPPDKVRVLYQGCDDMFRRQVSEADKENIRKKYHLPTDYVLYVGTVEERKNVMLLVRAVELMQQPVPVVIIGRLTDYGHRMQAYIRQRGLGSILFLDSVSFRDLPACYQMARLFVYPSCYEGFGIPLLEALCSGVPVIGCTGSCLEEAGGPDSHYVSPDDAEGLAALLVELWDNQPARRQMIAKGLQYAKRFDTALLAEQMYKLYTSLLTQ